MILLPAIDLLAGRCVRLRQGDFSTAHQVAGDPLAAARSFASAGARWIHLVDLDGAKSGSPQNREIIFQIARETGLQVETGGGIRDLETIRTYLEHGVARVVLGSAVWENPGLAAAAVREFGERIAVGIDSKQGKVAVRGWLDTTQMDDLDAARQMEQAGVQWILFTDIATDGMLSGPNLDRLAQLRGQLSCHLVASGGVRNLSDLQALDALSIDGAILGKSLYSGGVCLKEAVRWANGPSSRPNPDEKEA